MTFPKSVPTLTPNLVCKHRIKNRAGQKDIIGWFQEYLPDTTEEEQKQWLEAFSYIIGASSDDPMFLASWNDAPQRTRIDIADTFNATNELVNIQVIPPEVDE